MDRFTKVLFIFILACGALSWASVAISVVKFLIIPIFGVITLYKIYKAIKFFFPYKNNTVPVNGLVDYKKIENKNEENDRSINDDIPYKVQRERQIKEEKEKLIEKNKKIEEERKQNRDSDKQETPYIYQIGTHGNESLAIRYGIANLEKKIKEYWYHAKGGEKIRNKDRDEVYFEPSSKIELKKVKKVGENMYEVLLTNYKDRRAKVVIEVGTEYVKTFYPMNESWFAKHAELEKTLKGNGTFTLKELATFHVQKTVNL